MPDILLEIKVTLCEISCFLKHEALFVIKAASQFISEYFNELKLPVTAVVNELKYLPVNLLLSLTVVIMLFVSSTNSPVIPQSYIYENNTTANLTANSTDSSSLSESSQINEVVLKISDIFW